MQILEKIRKTKKLFFTPKLKSFAFVIYGGGLFVLEWRRVRVNTESDFFLTDKMLLHFDKRFLFDLFMLKK